MNDTNLSAFLWSIAELLRGDYKQSEYGKVILPFTVLRRLDCVLAPTKDAVLAEKKKRTKPGANIDPFLIKASKQKFYNTSPFDLKKLLGAQDDIAENLIKYIDGFSADVRDIFEHFDLHTQIDRLAKAKLLYMVVERFANADLHPARVTNTQMGMVFEELIRRFAELSNETAGEHFTPREVIRLMVDLLFIEDHEILVGSVVRKMYDPTAGTGGMLSVASEHLHAQSPDARLVVFGQELNAESHAICKADMLIKGEDIQNIIFGNTLSADGLKTEIFDYGNTAIEKRAIFYRRVLPLLEFGRERETIDLSKVRLTHHTLKDRGKAAMPLGDGETPKLEPLTEAGAGTVQEKQKAHLREIIEKLNTLFEGELTDGDMLVYVTGVIRGKLLESPTLARQAASNTKEQFAASPDLRTEMTNAIVDSHDAHIEMSTQALNSEKLRASILEILLNYTELYEELRKKSA